MNKIIHTLRNKLSLLSFIFVNVLLLYIYASQVGYPAIVYNETVGTLFKSIANQKASLIAYFRLAEENEQLKLENTKLRNLMKQNFMIDYRDSLVGNRNKIYLSETDKPWAYTSIAKKYAWVRSTVIKRINRVGKNLLILNTGSNEGITKSSPVIGNIGIIGKVIKVYPSYCIVSTIYDEDFRLSAKVTKNGSTGILYWTRNNLLDLTLSEIPTSDSVAIGDSVYTSHLSYRMPTNILIGTVNDIKPIDKYYYQLSINPIEQISISQSVYVIKDMEQYKAKEYEVDLSTFKD